MSQQVPLPLRLHTEWTFEHVQVGDNGTTFALLQQLAKGTGPLPIFLHGPSGVGKTHLLQATCREASENGLRAMAVPIALLEGSSPSILEGLGEMDLIGLDDLDGVAGDRAWEEALFALFNALYDRRAHLIITAKEPPGSLPLIIEDLRSRLTSGPVLAIKPLNPDQTAEALIIHAENRGIHLSNPVAEYLTKRVQRDLPSLLLWLEKIDQASLSAGRPMTIPMLRRLLESED